MNKLEKKRAVLVKSPMKFTEQIEILVGKNLIIKDKQWAESVLRRVNYYRLSAYTLSRKTGDRFQDGVTFEEIYELYDFDNKFRYLVLGLLGSIETAFRTQIAYVLAHKYGALGHTVAANFQSQKHHKKILETLDNEIKRSNEVFIEHHKNKYGGQFPAWVAIEVTSFGLLSKIFANMKNEDKAVLCEMFYDSIPHKYIRSWLHTLSTFRNICAHYGRTYNRNLPIKPILFKIDTAQGVTNSRAFAVLFIMKRLILDEKEWSLFFSELKSLIKENNKVNLTLMGFPSNWEALLSPDPEGSVSEVAATEDS